MVVLRRWRTRNGPGVRLIRARGPRRLRTRLNPTRLGWSDRMGPLKRRHLRRRRRGVRWGGSLAVVTRDPERGQFLK